MIATARNIPALFARYWQVLGAAWSQRKDLQAPARNPLERQFLPAALELIETPAPAAPRAIMWALVAALVVGLLWSWLGRVDMVAVASGKVISADKTKLVQPAETAVVRRIHVSDGQHVDAGQLLVELEAAATAPEAETERAQQALNAARLEAARYAALTSAGQARQAEVRLPALTGIHPDDLRSEQRAAQSQYLEHRARLTSFDAEISRRSAELAASRELVQKLTETLPIARSRAEDYKSLVERNFVSRHGYLEREQVRIEQERDLGYQHAHALELMAGIEEARSRRAALIAEFERNAIAAQLEAQKRANQLEQELIKARTREVQQKLIAPVAGTVQQLAIHTEGGVVTEAQPLMAIVPDEQQAEVEAVLENRDVGFVQPGQRAVIKVETFPFTRYGTIEGEVAFVSQDAVADEKKGLVFQARVRLKRAELKVDERIVPLSPGMAVTAEIHTGNRRVIEYFLDPIRKTINESLGER
jgi:hemolysin D